jgi:Uma2 family endonuclease
MSELLRVLSPEAYLAAERTADVRHEYVACQVYALAGARAVHNVIVFNLSGLLWQRLQGSPCRGFGSSTKLRAAADRFYYPDLMIQCDPFGLQLEYMESPRYVAEVTSPSTRRTDVTEKSEAYRRVPSIEAYVIVAQDVMQVLAHRRAAEDWATEILGRPEDCLRLDGIGFEGDLAAIYAGTGLDG